jgi:autotransporter-associated beta strand protein
VRFDDSATGSTSISVQNGGAAVQPAAVVFANNTKNYSISGDPINTSGNLVINGTGTVTLNNTNSYGAGIIVNAGTLTVGATGSLGSGPLVVNNLNVGDGTAVTAEFQLRSIDRIPVGCTRSSGVWRKHGDDQLERRLTVNQQQDGVYDGVIAGTGGLTKTGTGALTLTGAKHLCRAYDCERWDSAQQRPRRQPKRRPSHWPACDCEYWRNASLRN